MINKILGYILMFVGLTLISYTCWESYNIFSNKVLPPEIFKTQAQVTNKSSGNLGGEIQAQMQDIIKKQLQDVMPADSIPKILNLFSWSILAGILIFAGSQITGIGIKLLKIIN